MVPSTHVLQKRRVGRQQPRERRGRRLHLLEARTRVESLVVHALERHETVHESWHCARHVVDARELVVDLLDLLAVRLRAQRALDARRVLELVEQRKLVDERGRARLDRVQVLLAQQVHALLQLRDNRREIRAAG